MIRREFSVDVWSKLDSKWLPFGDETRVYSEAEVASLKMRGWTVRATQVERLDAVRAGQLAEVERMAAEVEARTLPASVRAGLRIQLQRHKTKVMGG